MEIRLVTAAFRPYNPLFDRWANPLSSWEALSGEGDSRSEAEELKRKEADLPKIVPKVNSLEDIVSGSLSSGGPLEQAVFMLSKEKPSLEKQQSSYSFASSMSYSYPQQMLHVQNPISYAGAYERGYESYGEAKSLYSARQSNEFGFYAPLPVYPLELVLQRKSSVGEPASSLDYASKSQMSYTPRLQVNYAAMPKIQQSNGQVSLYSGNYSVQNRVMAEPQVQSNPLLQRHVLEYRAQDSSDSKHHVDIQNETTNEKTARVELQLSQPLFSKITKEYQSPRDPPRDPERQMFPDQISSKKEKPYAMQAYSDSEPLQIDQRQFYSQNPAEGFNLGRVMLPNSFEYNLKPNASHQVISFPEVSKEYQSDRRLRPRKLRQQEQRPPIEPNRRVAEKEMSPIVDSEIDPVQFKSYEAPRFEAQLPIRSDNDNRRSFESIDSVIESNPLHKAKEITKKYDHAKKFDTKTRKSLDDFVAKAKELGYGNVSVFVYNTKTGEQYAVNADKIVATPSINKLPLAWVISYFIQEGKLDPNQKIKVQKNLVHDREKQTYEAFSEEGRELDYKTLMKWMVEGSINSATNHLLYFLGEGDYNRGMRRFVDTMEQLGVGSIEIASLYLRGHNYHANKASAKDLSKFMDILHNGDILDKEYLNPIRDYLRSEQWTAGFRNAKALQGHETLPKPTVTEKGMGISGIIDDNTVYSVIFNDSEKNVYSQPADKKHINNKMEKTGIDTINLLSTMFPILAKISDKPSWVVRDGAMYDSESPEEAVYRLLSEKGRSVEMQYANFYDIEKRKHSSDWIVVDKKNPERFIEYIVKKDNTIDILDHRRDFEYSKEFKRLMDNAKNKNKDHEVESKRIDLDKYRGRTTYEGAIIAEMIKSGKSMEESIRYASNSIVTGQRDSRYRGGILLDKKSIVGNEFATIEAAVETKQTLFQKVASYFRA